MRAICTQISPPFVTHITAVDFPRGHTAPLAYDAWRPLFESAPIPGNSRTPSGICRRRRVQCWKPLT